MSLENYRLCVSKNVSPAFAQALSHQSGVPLTTCFGKYLGIPLLDKRVTKRMFSEVIGNV